MLLLIYIYTCNKQTWPLFDCCWVKLCRGDVFIVNFLFRKGKIGGCIQQHPYRMTMLFLLFLYNTLRICCPLTFYTTIILNKEEEYNIWMEICLLFIFLFSQCHYSRPVCWDCVCIKGAKLFADFQSLPRQPPFEKWSCTLLLASCLSSLSFS